MINVTKLKQQLKQGQVKSLYLFCGEELYLMDMYVKKITDAALGSGLAEFNYSFYNEDNENYELFVNDVESYPVMSEKKVIVLKSVSFITQKEYQKPLAELFSKLPEYVTVIIVAPEGNKIKKALMDVIAKNGEVVDFKKQSATDLQAWINIRFSRAGKYIKPEDAQYLINLCERSLEKLTVETDKLLSGTSEPQISRELINSLVKVPVEYKIFEMTEMLLRGDLERAYLVLEGFKVTKVQPIVVFSVIYGQLSDLLMFKLLGEERVNAADYIEPNRKWLAPRLAADCLRYPKDRLRNGMRLCAEYDLEVKKGNIEGFTALELMMAQF